MVKQFWRVIPDTDSIPPREYESYSDARQYADSLECSYVIEGYYTYYKKRRKA